MSITSTGGVPDQPSSSLRRAHATTDYDDQGRVSAEHLYSVDQSTGALSTYTLNTKYYYNHRGLLSQESDPGAGLTKVAYDGAGRQTVVYLTDGEGGSSWDSAFGVGGDRVAAQVETTYDANGNVILTTTRERFSELQSNAYGALVDPASNVKARVYYATAYYDLADRLTATVDVGTNGGSAYTRPGSVPSRSDTVLVSSYAYNAAGWVSDVTDPRALVTHQDYNNLGWVTKSIEGYVDGTPSAADDRTTAYTYDGSGHVLTVQAQLPSGGVQATQYNYGVTTGTGSAVNSNDVLASIWYPNLSTGAASSSLKETYTVNALGDVQTLTDRNGSLHTYTYDVLGRTLADSVTPGTNVDGTVKRLETAYDTGGRPYLFTSYDAASGGNIVNQVQYGYNGLGQLTNDYQAHSGAVSVGTTPAVTYTYSEMAGGANHSRLTNILYPNGRNIKYTCSGGYDGAINDALSRVFQVSDNGGQVWEQLGYLGAGTIVYRWHPYDGVGLSYWTGTAADAGDGYSGLDRFGRIVDQLWATSGGTVKDRFAYGYDRDSNALYRENMVNSAFCELYHVNGSGNGYDGLNRLAAFSRGTLNGGKDTISSPSHSQSYTLDTLGNFGSITTDGVTQTRTANQQNEITSISSLTTPTYDSNGNLTKDEQGQGLVFDAWNRLTVVKNSGGTPIGTFTYDALGRRQTEVEGGTTRHLYYDARWQVIEERVGASSSAAVQYVWSLQQDVMILRDRDSDGNGTLDEKLLPSQDANGNVTALVNAAGNVVERYVYDPYGKVTIYDATWSNVRPTSAYGWVYLYQGLRRDFTVGLDDNRWRFYSYNLGVFVGQDPLRYGAGYSNFYGRTGNNPVNWTDPSGLANGSVPPPGQFGPRWADRTDSAAREAAKQAARVAAAAAARAAAARAAWLAKWLVRGTVVVGVGILAYEVYEAVEEHREEQRQYDKAIEEKVRREKLWRPWRPDPCPSAKFTHDKYVQKVRPGAKERTFYPEGQRQQGGLGSRRYDDFDPATGTGYEGNTTPWSQMTQEKLQEKLHQVASDILLLKDPTSGVKKVIWFGTEELPTTGAGGQLRTALERAGIEYRVIKP